MKHLKFIIISITIILLIMLLLFFNKEQYLENGNLRDDITDNLEENTTNNLSQNNLTQESEQGLIEEDGSESGFMGGGPNSSGDDDIIEPVEDCVSRGGTCYDLGAGAGCKQYNNDLILHSGVPCLVSGTKIIDPTKICCVIRD